MDEMGENAHIFIDKRLDFSNTRTVFVKKELYAFKFGSPVLVYKLADFTSTQNLVNTPLPILPRNEFLGNFSACQVAGRIVLTGGYGADTYSA